jgi:fucose permease
METSGQCPECVGTAFWMGTQCISNSDLTTGDIVVCASCGAVLAVGVQGILSEPTLEHYEQMSETQLATLAAVRMAVYAGMVVIDRRQQVAREGRNETLSIAS